MTKVRYPTSAELYALELEARRARARAIAGTLDRWRLTRYQAREPPARGDPPP